MSLYYTSLNCAQLIIRKEEITASLKALKIKMPNKRQGNWHEPSDPLEADNLINFLPVIPTFIPSISHLNSEEREGVWCKGMVGGG